MFTLAQISDPHLAPLPQPQWHQLCNKRITGYINWRRNRRFVHDSGVLQTIVADLKAQQPDHIACLGDLANIALPEEFTRGRAWLERLGKAHDVSLVAGNHDAYVRGGLENAAREWGAYLRGDDGGTFPYLRTRGPLALIGLCTALPTPWGFATGRLGPAQLAQLAELLVAMAHEHLFRVILIHHPPTSQAKPHKLLQDADALKRVIAAHGAELILHGHDHLAMLNWLDGPSGTRVPAVGVPSASAAPGKAKNAAAYNLYRIDGTPEAWTCEMISRGLDDLGEVKESRKIVLTPVA
ncbi:MAG TPA: metallophosphoesterase [Pseudolabrys sp.]|nr:metallophosphoesterase [Pseudolabrys sp.]